MKLTTTSSSGIPEVSPQTVFENSEKLKLIDVRTPDEFTGELGHIDGSVLVTLGPDLEEFLHRQNKEEEIVFICRSGTRSGNATLISRSLGFKKTYNMTGGMIAWNSDGLPVEFD